MGKIDARTCEGLMKRSTDRILEILQDCPAGLTAKEVADRLGASPSNIGSRLSKFAAYGIISAAIGGLGRDVSAQAASANQDCNGYP